MSKYIYTFTKDNIKFLDKVFQYIKNISELPSDFDLYIESQLEIVFNQELDSNQINILNNAIQIYIPPQELEIISNTKPMMLIHNTISTNIYSTIATDYFLAEQITDSIRLGYVTCVSNIIGNGSYKLRLFDAINNKIIGESDSLNNSNLQIINIINLINIPENNTLLELQGQVSDTTSICIIKLAHLIYTENITF